MSRRVHDPDRRAGVGRHRRVGLDDDRRRRGSSTRRASATRTATPPLRAADPRRSSPTSSWRDADVRGGVARDERGAAQRRPARASRRARSPPSTRRCGTARRAASASPLVDLLGAAHDDVPVYGSGGFCSYSLERLREQLGGWVAAGIPRVKMKLGRDPRRRPAAARRRARGDRRRRRALRRRERRVHRRSRRSRWAERYALEWGVTLVRGAGLVRRPRRPAAASATRRRALDVAAGEYALRPADFRNIVGCVDCLQARRHALRRHHRRARDGSRTRTALDVSAHCAPRSRRTCSAPSSGAGTSSTSTTTSASRRCCSTACSSCADGALRPDRSRPGNGLELKRKERRSGGRQADRRGRSRTSARAGCRSCSPRRRRCRRRRSRFEIYLEHYKGSFGDKWMWTPIVADAAADRRRRSRASSRRRRRARCCRRSARSTRSTALIGIVTHVRGVQKRPGGFDETHYNLVMGPPLLAPGSLALVGAMGVLAAIVKRER